jgi:hypothetical protein
MTELDDLRKRIEANEKEALFFMEFNDLEYAEKILLDNINNKASSILTYDLLIKIYHKKSDLASLLKLLDSAIQNTPKKGFYRKLKKQIVLFRFLSDLNQIDA